MSRPLPVQNDWSEGMKRDPARNRMPPNSAWNLEDILLGYGAAVRERGGWSYASAAAISASALYVVAGAYATFALTAFQEDGDYDFETIVCIDEDGVIYTSSELSRSPVSHTNAGSVGTVHQNPFFHGAASPQSDSDWYSGLLIVPRDGVVPKKIDATLTLSNLNGSPPHARFGCVYKDYTVLGNGSVSSVSYPGRIWFSPPGDPDVAASGAVTAWDTTDSWVDMSRSVKGLAGTRNALIIFTEEGVARLQGETPPPDSDMSLDDPWLDIGLLSAFSIVEHEETVIWCAPEGVFRTDGVSLDDITLKGGMQKYWLDTTGAQNVVAAAGVLRGKLFISVLTTTGTLVDAFMIDLQNYAWTRLTNVRTSTFWSGRWGTTDELFFGPRTVARVARMETVFAVGNATYKNDADGTAVTSVLETPFYELGRPGQKVIKSAFIGHELTDYATDNPTVQVSLIRTPEETTYTVLDSFAENTEYERDRMPIGGRASGVAFKFERFLAGDFLLHDIAVELGYLEESKRP